jgi:rhodanese-related sulfurtransferase
VRSLSEYKAGHPEHAYNVPYPYINQTCDMTGRYPDGACKKSVSTTAQSAADFVAYVEQLIPNKDTPIYTLCRTGVRSVGAANRLTEAGYTKVRNMWEGFVGVNLKAPFFVYEADDGDPNTPPVKVMWDHDNNPSTAMVPKTEDLPVDLNHDGVLTDEDKNGWLYHLALPYDTRLLPKLIYKPYADQY